MANNKNIGDYTWELLKNAASTTVGTPRRVTDNMPDWAKVLGQNAYNAVETVKDFGQNVYDATKVIRDARENTKNRLNSAVTSYYDNLKTPDNMPDWVKDLDSDIRNAASDTKDFYKQMDSKLSYLPEPVRQRVMYPFGYTNALASGIIAQGITHPWMNQQSQTGAANASPMSYTEAANSGVAPVSAVSDNPEAEQIAVSPLRYSTPSSAETEKAAPPAAVNSSENQNPSWWDNTVNAVGEGLGAAGNAIAQGATDVWNGVTGWFDGNKRPVSQTSGITQADLLKMEEYEKLQNLEENAIRDYDTNMKYAEDARANALKLAEQARTNAKIEAEAQFRQNAANYGLQGERMLEQGLAGGGYSEFLEGKNMETRALNMGAANASYLDNAQNAQTAYNEAEREAGNQLMAAQDEITAYKHQYSEELQAEREALYQQILSDVTSGLIDANTAWAMYNVYGTMNSKQWEAIQTAAKAYEGKVGKALATQIYDDLINKYGASLTRDLYVDSLLAMGADPLMVDKIANTVFDNNGKLITATATAERLSTVVTMVDAIRAGTYTDLNDAKTILAGMLGISEYELTSAEESMLQAAYNAYLSGEEQSRADKLLNAIATMGAEIPMTTFEDFLRNTLNIKSDAKVKEILNEMFDDNGLLRLVADRDGTGTGTGKAPTDKDTYFDNLQNSTVNKQSWDEYWGSMSVEEQINALINSGYLDANNITDDSIADAIQKAKKDFEENDNGSGTNSGTSSSTNNNSSGAGASVFDNIFGALGLTAGGAALVGGAAAATGAAGAVIGGATSLSWLGPVGALAGGAIAYIVYRLVNDGNSSVLDQLKGNGGSNTVYPNGGNKPSGETGENDETGENGTEGGTDVEGGGTEEPAPPKSDKDTKATYQFVIDTIKGEKHYVGDPQTVDDVTSEDLKTFDSDNNGIVDYDLDALQKVANLFSGVARSDAKYLSNGIFGHFTVIMDGTDYMVREGDTVHINKEVSDLVNSGALKPGEVFGYDRELYMVKGDKIIKIEPGIFRNGDYEPLWKELYGKAIDVLAGNSTFAEDKGGVETPETGTTPDESTPDEKDPSLKRGHATMSYSRYDSGWTVNVDGFDYSVIRGEVIEDTALNREILDAAKSVDSGEVFVYDDILYYKDEENGRIYEVTPRRQSDYNKVKNAITANAETWDKYTGSANKTGGTYVRGDLAKGKTVNVEKDGKTYKFEIDAVMGADTEAAKAANAAGLGDGEVFRHREDMYVYKNGKAYKLSAVAGFQNWHYDAYVEAATGQKTWPEGDFNYSDFLKEENQGSGNASTENSGGAQNGTQNGTQGGSGGGNVGGAENTATGDPVKREETDTDDSYKAKVQAWITEEFFDKNENGELNLKEGYEKKILDRGDLVTSGYSDNFINALDKTDDGKYVWYDFKAAQTITSDYLESINAKITDGGQWEIKEGKFTVNGKEYRVDKATVPELEGKASNSAGNCFVEYNSETYYLQKNEGRITPLKINKNSVSDAIGSVEKQGYWDKNNIDVEVGGKTYHVYIGTKLKESNDNDAEVISAANSAGIQSGEVFAYGDAMYIKNGSDYHKIGQQDWLYYDHDEQLLEALKTGEKTKRPEIGEVVQNKNGKAYFAGEVKGGTSQKVQIEGRTYDITLETIKYGKDTDIYSASKNIDTNSFFVYDDKLYVKGEDGVYGVGGNDWDKLKSFVVDGRGEARAITGYPGAITTNRTVLGQAPNKFTVRYGAKVAEFQTMGNELKFNANNDPGIKYASRNVGNNEVFVYGDEVYYKDEQGKIFATNADDKTTNTIKDILMNSRAPKFEYADMQGVKIDATEQVRKNTFETMGSDFNFNSSMVPVDIDIKDGMSVYLDSKDPRNTTIGKVIKVFTDESSLTSDARRAGVEDGAIFVIDGVLYVYVEQEINKVNKSFVFQIDPTENAKNIIESYKNSASPMSYTGQLSEVAPAAKSGGEREYGYSDYLI